MDKFSFEELDGFEEEEVVEEESILVSDAGDDATMGVVASLRCIFIGVGPQQLQHQLGRHFTKRSIANTNRRLGDRHNLLTYRTLPMFLILNLSRELSTDFVYGF